MKIKEMRQAWINVQTHKDLEHFNLKHATSGLAINWAHGEHGVNVILSAVKAICRESDLARLVMDNLDLTVPAVTVTQTLLFVPPA